jgi:16S rRNA (uracil1498-N3)-methyltransferase
MVAVERVAQDARPAVELILAQALIKPARFEWAVEKATELGVDRIVPLVTARTLSQPSAAQGQAKHLRWQRIAAESARQCRRSTVPGIDPVTPFASFVDELSGCSMLLPTLTATTPSLSEALVVRRQRGRVAILIGPEGDFTAEEVAHATRAGAVPVSLGRFTLRSETASVACLAVAQSLFSSSAGKPDDRRR